VQLCAFVGLDIGSTASQRAIRFFAAIVVLDLVAVPWPYVFKQFIQAIGTRSAKTDAVSA